MSPRDDAAAPPRSVVEALARARHHGERAAREGAAAARALLEAASLGTLGRPAAEAGALAGLLAAIDDVTRALDGGGAASPLFDALHDALDTEIERWQTRAQTDPDARAVLRTFLGAREVLWEMGVRRSPRRSPGPEGPKPEPEGRKPEPPPSAGSRGRPTRRVQRIELDD